MDTGLIILNFMAIALMRVVQKVSAKKVSREVQGRIFFRYDDITIYYLHYSH